MNIRIEQIYSHKVKKYVIRVYAGKSRIDKGQFTYKSREEMFQAADKIKASQEIAGNSVWIKKLVKVKGY